MKTCRERCHLVYVILVLAVLLAPTAEAHAQFIHQIPLKLPKGANGMQPQLALAYDPNSGNGMVGAGWQLTGLSSITRVNYGNGINYGGNDTYPHSGLGILVKQGDGSYRNKRESFTKFVPSGVCGDGPCSWVAYDRSGTQYWYGTTADSQLTILPFPLPLISPPVREWALTKVVDVFGNSYEVTYTDDLANGRIYPSVITYTKGPGLSTYRTVEFEYEGRSDMEPGYQQSVFTQMACG